MTSIALIPALTATLVDALVRARPQVQAGLAIGKFVKEPFDEEARRNMFGQAAKEMGRK